MKSFTVYRGRNNTIELVLQLAGEPLEDPEAVTDVSLCLGEIEVDTESAHVSYDGESGLLTAALGRIDEIQALPDGVYEVEVTGYAADDDYGTAYGSFQIYLRDWCEDSNGS